VGQRSWHRDSPHDWFHNIDVFQNIDRLDGQPWYRGLRQRAFHGRRDCGRQAELCVGPTIGWSGNITRIAGQPHRAGARLPQVLSRMADTGSQQPPYDDEAGEQDEP